MLFVARKTVVVQRFCKISDESWQPTYIVGYLLCADDGYNGFLTIYGFQASLSNNKLCYL